MSTAVAARPPSRFPVVEATRLLGEIITWACPGVAVRHPDLIAALKSADLDPAVARELATRHAFARACKALSDQRIIRQVAEDEATIGFQFTAESRHGDRFTYDFETLLSLDKKTGAVTCDRPDLAARAQAELDRCVAVRTGSDITRVVQKLFEKHADLFPIRPQGGAYFCPAEHACFVDQVQSLLGRLGGRLLRFPVSAGTADGDRSVKEAVADGLAAAVAEHAAAVEAFGADTRPETVERAADRIKLTRFKVEAYSALLAEEKDRLDRALMLAAARLREKVGAIAAPAGV